MPRCRPGACDIRRPRAVWGRCTAVPHALRTPATRSGWHATPQVWPHTAAACNAQV